MGITGIEKVDEMERVYRRSDKDKQPLAKCLDEWIKDYIKRVGDHRHADGHHWAWEQLAQLEQKLWSTSEEIDGIYTHLIDRMT